MVSDVHANVFRGKMSVIYLEMHQRIKMDGKRVGEMDRDVRKQA